MCVSKCARSLFEKHATHGCYFLRDFLDRAGNAVIENVSQMFRSDIKHLKCVQVTNNWSLVAMCVLVNFIF